jgi:hypothetical protein
MKTSLQRYYAKVEENSWEWRSRNNVDTLAGLGLAG